MTVTKTLCTEVIGRVAVKPASAAGLDVNSTRGEERKGATDCRMSLQRWPPSFLWLHSRGKVWEPAQSSALRRGSS